MSNAGLTWWANRKSRMGLKPSAMPPPHLPGKAWWTTPPTTPPQPEHIEYVAQFHAQLQCAKPSRNRNAMQAYVAEWLRAARRLLHEERQSQRGDLHTTDGLVVAAYYAMLGMRSQIRALGGTVDEKTSDIINAMMGRSDRIRRERAMESAKRSNLPSPQGAKP